jgi:hypothetical protein
MRDATGLRPGWSLWDSRTMSVASHRHIDEQETEGPDWVERDPARAAAIGLVVAAVVIRLVIALQGFLANDDFVLDGQAAVSGLTPGFALHPFNDHFMPGALVIIWTFEHIFGLDYWPYAVVLAVGELIVGVLFYRLLRQFVGPGWRLLIPLAVLMFSPLTLEVTSGIIVGLNMLPMQIATILALGAMYKYTRTRHWRHLVSMGAAVVFALLFFEKALLIAPLLFIATACVFVAGDFWQSLRRTITRYWPAWLELVVICGAYLGVYVSRTAASSVHNPGGAGAVMVFLRQTGQTLTTSLVGGPWSWLGIGDLAPEAAPPVFAAVLATVVVLAFVVVTMARRRRAGRAWLMAALYVVITTPLIILNRLNALSTGTEGMAPKYIADAAPVIALAIALALFGMEGERANRVQPLRVPRELTPLIVLAGLVIGVGAGFSLYGFGSKWSEKAGREFLQTAQADLAKAPPGTVFFDQAVPPNVVQPLFYPATLESHFFRPLKNPPTFVDEGPKVSTFDSTGHIRPAYVAGPRIVPPKEAFCGYKVTGRSAMSLPLDGSIYFWPWAVRVVYISSGETTATLRLGGESHTFPVHFGQNEYFFHMTAGGSAFQLSVADPKVVLCVGDVAIGTPAPVPS